MKLIKDKNYFNSLIGEQLSSVEFVKDYLQLHFDGNDVTFYSWPIIDIKGIIYDYANNDYKNELCNLISLEVLSVFFVDNTELNIFFMNGAKIVLPLIRDDSNKNLKELLYYKDVNNNWFVLD